MKRGIDESAKLHQQQQILPYKEKHFKQQPEERVEVEIMELTDDEDLNKIEQAIENQISQEEIIKRLKIQYDDDDGSEEGEEEESEDD